METNGGGGERAPDAQYVCDVCNVQLFSGKVHCTCEGSIIPIDAQLVKPYTCTPCRESLEESLER